jgi:hypothetical protein
MPSGDQNVTNPSQPEWSWLAEVASGRVTDIPWRVREYVMSYTVDFTTVSTTGLESSPVAAALAGLRANEARYFKNKYDHVFTVELGHPAGGRRRALMSGASW